MRDQNDNYHETIAALRQEAAERQARDLERAAKDTLAEIEVLQQEAAA